MDQRAPSPPISRAGAPFAAQHLERFGPLPDLSSLATITVRDELLARARGEWANRALTEFRSVQIMTRFLEELLGSGESLDVYAGALEMIQEELRHTELCAAVCEALGGTARYPNPIALRDPATFRDSPHRDRALITALTMLAVNETISVAYITDLAARCTQPAISAVLHEIVADESTHDAYGWCYIRRAIPKASRDVREAIPSILRATIRPHDAAADRALADVPSARQALEEWPDTEEIQLGLFSPARQALIYRKAREDVLIPALRRADLTLP
jgi:hypothetical protein